MVLALFGLALAALFALNGLGSDPVAGDSVSVTVDAQPVQSKQIAEVDLTAPFEVGDLRWHPNRVSPTRKRNGQYRLFEADHLRQRRPLDMLRRWLSGYFVGSSAPQSTG